MTTRVIVTSNHGEGAETHVNVERRGADGRYVRDEAAKIVMVGPNQWREIYVPDNGQLVVSEHRSPAAT